MNPKSRVRTPISLIGVSEKVPAETKVRIILISAVKRLSLPPFEPAHQSAASAIESLFYNR
jgi:hypothetical protein